MQRISIIGAGWLGLPLGAGLARDGFAVQGTTTRQEQIRTLQEAGLKGIVLESSSVRESDLDALMQCEAMIVTVPPRGGEEEYGNFLKKIAGAALRNGLRKLIYTSATSVYEENNRTVEETDARPIVSSHSHIRLLPMEDIFREEAGLTPAIVRFGGLFGPGRNPGLWLGGRQNVSGADSPVNMIHLTDCLAAIRAILQKEAWGQTFNAVAPLHPTRRAFYAKACAAVGVEPPQWNEKALSWKKVSSRKLIDDLGFSFTYPDPSQAF